MKKLHIIILVVVVLGIGVFLFGGSQCPECSAPSSYSDCDDQAMKTRTNYRCSESTDFQCEGYTEETACATEIKLVGSFDGTIRPSVEEKVKGVIKIEVTNVPADTKLVAYYLEGGDLAPVGNGRMPEFATQQGDVWTGMLDTTKYSNGLYILGIVSNNQESLEGNPQAYAKGQIMISN